jgi:hypothetical protein
VRFDEAVVPAMHGSRLISTQFHVSMLNVRQKVIIDFAKQDENCF